MRCSSGSRISKWDWQNSTSQNLLVAQGAGRGRPILSGDVFGDWREELVLAANNSTLRIYTTTIPTKHRLYTLMHDPQYRLSIAWQNVAYNQPPHPSFYLGDGMKAPPKPNIQLVEPKTTP